MVPDVQLQVWPIFAGEARGHLQTIAEELLELQRDAAQPERLVRLRRVAHSLKGAAASLALEEIERLSHAVEESLQGFDPARGLEASTAVAILDAVAALERAVAGPAPSAVPGLDGLLAALHAVRGPASPAPGAGPGAPTPAASPEVTATLAELEKRFREAWGPTAVAGQAEEAIREGVAAAERLAVARPELAGPAREVQTAFRALAAGGLESARAAASFAGRLVALRRASTPPQPPPAAAPAPPGPQELPAQRDRAIRVGAETLDGLSRRVEQLVPFLAHAARRGRDLVGVEARLEAAVAELGAVRDRLVGGDTTGAALALGEVVRGLGGVGGAAGASGREALREAEAQRLAAVAIGEDLRALRTEPAALALEPLRRAVREAAVRLGKDVDLALSGEDVRLDRRILEALRDPLVHLVRNAVDHGVEAAEVRAAAGKPAQARVSVRVEPRGSRVGIVVEDDGGGLRLDRVRAAAVRRGALTEEAAAALPDPEAARLVFLPGLSTASEVTALSGRGVGLDVVNDAVVRLRGRIDLTSAPGKGTRFDLDLPLTLATARALVVRVGRERGVLPAEVVERVLRVRRADVGTAAGGATVAVAGAQLPFAHLGALLGRPVPETFVVLPALVLALGASRAVVAVDEVLGHEELAVASLGAATAGLRHLAGATVLDDGKVAAVLAPAELLRRARPGGARAEAPRARARILVADDSLTTRFATKSLLELAGYTVVAASDGAEALELARAGGIDLAVSDVQMPRLDGLGFTRAVKADPALAALPVVLVTSLGSPEDRAAGLAAGADGYLVKREVQAGRLLELVRQLLPVPA